MLAACSWLATLGAQADRADARGPAIKFVLVRALGDALSRADQRLLQDVRTVAAEHETRRAAVLRELQSLSARMGALPRSRGPFAALAEQALPLREQPTRGGADWRQAAANIEDEVVHHLKGRAAAS